MGQIENLLGAIAQTGRIVAAVTPDQLGKPTPCADWDVRSLLNHTISGVHMFDDAAQEKEFDMSRFGKDLVGTDPADAYDQAAATLEKTVREPGVLDRSWTMPFGPTPGDIAISIAMVESIQHGWDIARATGQDVDFDPELTEAAIQAAQLFPADVARQPGVFGPEQECGDDAPMEDRLAAYLGREV
jgi:uncharacterized protein (TIGR03086 family)